MADFSATMGLPPKLVISSASMCSIGPDIAAVGSFGPAGNGTWPSANLAIMWPFTLEVPATVEKVGWMNGTTATGNIDAGIYDTSYAKVVSLGSTAQSGTAAIQVGTLTATAMDPGRYFMAMSMSSASSTIDLWEGLSASWIRGFGFAQMASAVPLPSTFTPATYTNNMQPLLAFSFSPAVLL